MRQISNLVLFPELARCHFAKLANVLKTPILGKFPGVIYASYQNLEHILQQQGIFENRLNVRKSENATENLINLFLFASNRGKYPVHLYFIGQQRPGHQMQACLQIPEQSPVLSL